MSLINQVDDQEIARQITTRTLGIVEPGLRTAVDNLPAALRHVVGFHFGWWDMDGRAQNVSIGKLTRASLVLAACEAVGGGSDAINPAVAVELTHNYTLLHDDLMDGDVLRRLRPTVWSVFGVSDAILAGDALLAAAFRLLAVDSHPEAGQAAWRLASCSMEACEGQHADLAFERREMVTVDECIAMTNAKTGALFGCACALGALYGGADAKTVAQLDSFGRRLGMAAQFNNDLSGIWGDPALTGRSTGSDLAKRKKSLPVVAALTSDSEPGRELANLYASEDSLTPDQVVLAAQLVEAAGSRAWAESQVTQQFGTAVELLQAAVPDPDRARDLLALPRLISR